MKLKKPPSKARFKIRVFDSRIPNDSGKSFSVYETGSLTRDALIKRLKKKIEKW